MSVCGCEGVAARSEYVNHAVVEGQAWRYQKQAGEALSPARLLEVEEPQLAVISILRGRTSSRLGIVTASRPSLSEASMRPVSNSLLSVNAR